MTNIRCNKTLRRVLEANRVFLRERPEINAALINTFLAVAIWESKPDGTAPPLTIKALADHVDLPYTTVSRHLRYLGDLERQGVEGMGLVKTEIYMQNRRQKSVHLSRKGKLLRDNLLFVLGGADGNSA